MHHVVLALSFDEVHPRNLLRRCETMHLTGEPVGDLGQRCGRGNREPELTLHVAEQPTSVLQLRHVDVAVHPVDALHLEPHMIGKHFGDAAHYGHHGSDRAGGQQAN